MSIFRYKNEQGEWVELPFLRGPQGPSGADGKDGKNGIDGTNGKDGKDGVGIAKTEINAEGRLVVTYTDGTSETLSKVVGADGKDGANGADGKDGVNGKNGTDGIGISKTEISADGQLVITYTDNTTSNLGVVVGVDGKNGTDGTNGTNGVDGYTPIKGTDYFTEADKQELVQLVLESLPSAEEVAF